jgi:peptidoglycan L-alanyl-D-glutamate endopeptidase CwlK
MRFDEFTLHLRSLICAEAGECAAAYDGEVSRLARRSALMERTMLAIIVAVLFLLACGAGWLLLFPDAGDAVQRAILSLAARAARGAADARESASHRMPGAVAGSRAEWQSAAAFLRRHRWPALAAAALIVAPTLAVWLAGGEVTLPGAEERAVNAHLENLLRGERLVPPPSLPPMTFTTAEVMLVRPMLDSANRNWTLLDPDFNRRLLAVFKIMRERYGYEMALLEGYRSPERQNQLADAGSSVTNARAFQSYHQFGLAADCAFLRNGKLVISERDPWAMLGYQLYGEVAESLGLKWGGHWTMMDFGHIELRKPRTGN